MAARVQERVRRPTRPAAAIRSDAPKGSRGFGPVSSSRSSINGQPMEGDASFPLLVLSSEELVASWGVRSARNELRLAC